MCVNPENSPDFPSFSRQRLPHAHDYSQIVTLLQQQQETLQQVLKGQKKRQDQFESDFIRLQSSFEALRDSTHSSMTDSGSDRKRKRVVTRDLSVSVHHWTGFVFIVVTMFQKKVSSIHDAREEGFRPQES